MVVNVDFGVRKFSFHLVLEYRLLVNLGSSGLEILDTKEKQSGLKFVA